MSFLVIREGFKKKKWFLSLWGLTPPPLESDKNIFYFFWILDHFLSTFWKKWFFAPRNAENTKKNFQNLLKNELKAVKVASQQAVSATLNDMSGAPRGVLAPPDSHLNSRGLEVPSGGSQGGLEVPQGGDPPYTWKKFYGLKLIFRPFEAKKIKK